MVYPEPGYENVSGVTKHTRLVTVTRQDFTNSQLRYIKGLQTAIIHRSFNGPGTLEGRNI